MQGLGLERGHAHEPHLFQILEQTKIEPLYTTATTSKFAIRRILNGA